MCTWLRVSKKTVKLLRALLAVAVAYLAPRAQVRMGKEPGESMEMEVFTSGGVANLAVRD